VTARRLSAALAGLGLVATAACQPLPHPFAYDRPPAALMVVPDSIDIAVGTIEGEPRATAQALSGAVASELLRHNIAASATTTSHTSYVLDGRIEESPPQAGQATVTVYWRLRDAAGHVLDEHSNHLAAAAREWQDGAEAKVTQLAAASAEVLASLVTEATPKEQPGSGRVRVAVRKIGGAPGDGNASLANSMAAVLKHADVDIVDAANGKPDLDVDADITVEPKANQQHVKIVWHVSRANGGEVGTVAQENDLPHGRLDGPWGDIAYNVAIAAGTGIMRLVDRGAPPIKLGATATAAATPPPSPAPPTSPLAAGSPAPGGSPPPLAPGNIASPAVNLPPVDVTPSAPDRPADVPVLLPYRGVYLPR
jgi:hypothetical protein